MSDQRVSVETRQVEMVLSDGQRLNGEIFLQLHGASLTGPQRVGEVLNGEEHFLPLRSDGRVRLINLIQVVSVTVDAAEEFDPLLELGEQHAVRVVAGGCDPIEALIYVNLPNARNRTRDFLDQHKRFLLFRRDDQVIYLARRRILQVED